MPSSGMCLRVALVRTDFSEERIASIIRVEIIIELETLTVTSQYHLYHQGDKLGTTLAATS
jgi:hypothetical protein